MKYKLVTDGEKFAVERQRWFIPWKEYRNLKHGDFWSMLGSFDIEECWGTREQAVRALYYLNKRKLIKEVKE